MKCYYEAKCQISNTFKMASIEGLHQGLIPADRQTLVERMIGWWHQTQSRHANSRRKYDRLVAPYLEPTNSRRKYDRLVAPDPEPTNSRRKYDRLVAPDLEPTNSRRKYDRLVAPDLEPTNSRRKYDRLVAPDPEPTGKLS